MSIFIYVSYSSYYFSYFYSLLLILLLRLFTTYTGVLGSSIGWHVCAVVLILLLILQLRLFTTYAGVLGSSIGWHVFYGALTWEVRARGWEILCSQVFFLPFFSRLTLCRLKRLCFIIPAGEDCQEPCVC
jgi:hypothetical protein